MQSMAHLLATLSVPLLECSSGTPWAAQRALPWAMQSVRQWAPRLANVLALMWEGQSVTLSAHRCTRCNAQGKFPSRSRQSIQEIAQHWHSLQGRAPKSKWAPL